MGFVVAAIPELLWWVIVIFMAGIIGQFGKSLTLKILDRFSKGKDGDEKGEREEVTVSAEPEVEVDPKELKKRTKEEKKRRKKEAKARKKAGDDGL